MGLVATKCSSCGGKIRVDDTYKRGICPYCKTEFITEDIVQNVITNIETQNNYYYGTNDKFNEEKNQCKILLMMLKNLDFNSLEDRALKVLDVNYENQLAQTIYKCKFEFQSFLDRDFVALEFNADIVAEYFKNNRGKVDAEVSLLFIKLLSYKPTVSGSVGELLSAVMDNLDSLDIDKEQKKEFFTVLKDTIENKQQINKLRSIARGRYFNALSVGIFEKNSYAATALRNDSNIAKKLANNLLKNRENLKNIFNYKINVVDGGTLSNIIISGSNSKEGNGPLVCSIIAFISSILGLVNIFFGVVGFCLGLVTLPFIAKKPNEKSKLCYTLSIASIVIAFMIIIVCVVAWFVAARITVYSL